MSLLSLSAARAVKQNPVPDCEVWPQIPRSRLFSNRFRRPWRSDPSYWWSSCSGWPPPVFRRQLPLRETPSRRSATTLGARAMPHDSYVANRLSRLVEPVPNRDMIAYIVPRALDGPAHNRLARAEILMRRQAGAAGLLGVNSKAEGLLGVNHSSYDTPDLPDP